jgi:hypothetical protein
MSMVISGKAGDIRISSDHRVTNDTWLVDLPAFEPIARALRGCICDACQEARRRPPCPNCGESSLRQEPKHDAWSCLCCGFEIDGELVAR